MSICENIANDIVSILKKELPLYTDGISMSTEPEEVMTPFREATANDILVLADDVKVSIDNDGNVTKAFVWLSVDGKEVCINAVENKVRVGDYAPFELYYNDEDDVIGIYNELATGEYA